MISSRYYEYRICNKNASLINVFHICVDNPFDSLVKTDALLNKGVIVVDEDNNVVREIGSVLVRIIDRECGVNQEMWSESFHKTWGKVHDASIEELVMEQAIHYFSTYGMKAMGLNVMPVIPAEKIIADPDMMPSGDAFTVIRVVSVEAAVEIIKDYLMTTVAPNRDKIKHIAEVVNFVDIDLKDIMSFELKCLYCDAMNIVPENGQDFIRYAIYKTTGISLVVKNKKTIEAIRENARKLNYYQQKKIANLFKQIPAEELARVFYRNKPLILAFKGYAGCAPIINKVRRLATKCHEPLSDVRVANIVNLLKEKRFDDVERLLKGVNNRSLIKLYNFANSEITNSDARIFNIRNGEVFVKPVLEDRSDISELTWLLGKLREQLSSNFEGKLCGNTYYIPEYIEYAAPVSEKQMLGNIPYGTTLSAKTDDGDLCAAIYWENNGDQTDLDLHMGSAKCSYGWNSGYRSESRDVMYSGDMTDATDGAVEAFRFKATDDEPYLFSVYRYSCGGYNVPFKFFVTSKGFTENIGNCSVCSVEDALFAPINLSFSEKSGISLGYFLGSTFTFYEGDLGSRLCPDPNMAEPVLKAMLNRTASMLPLADIIELAGGKIIHSMDDMADGVIDLSPSNITERVVFDIID